MMFLKLTLYFVIGFIGMFFMNIHSFRGFVKAILLVIFWPFYLLLKYVEMVDQVKLSNQRQLEE